MSAYDDLVDRLRQLVALAASDPSMVGKSISLADSLLIEAADAIEALEAEIDRHHKDFERWEAMADAGARRIQENKDLRAELDEIRNVHRYVRRVDSLVPYCARCGESKCAAADAKLERP